MAIDPLMPRRKPGHQRVKHNGKKSSSELNDDIAGARYLPDNQTGEF
jgi:hypothetical protein